MTTDASPETPCGWRPPARRIGVTYEMSVTLRRAACAANIKTRLDLLCVLLEAQVRMVAQ